MAAPIDNTTRVTVLLADLLPTAAHADTTPTANLVAFLDEPAPLTITEPDTDGAVSVDLDGEVGWDITADAVTAMLRDLPADATRLDVYLNSGGGAVWQGIKIANMFRAVATPVTVHVVGVAASAASVMAMGADRVVMHPGTMLMVHNARATIMSGTAEDMTSAAELLTKINSNLSEIYSARAGGTPEAWATVMASEAWMTPTEAVAAGLADEIVEGSGTAETNTERAAVAVAGFSYANVPDHLTAIAAAIDPHLTGVGVGGGDRDTEGAPATTTDEPVEAVEAVADDTPNQIDLETRIVRLSAAWTRNAIAAEANHLTGSDHAH